MNSLCPNLSSSLTDNLKTTVPTITGPAVAHPYESARIEVFLPQSFARHLLVRNAVVGQRLVPHRVQGVLQRLGAELVGLRDSEKCFRGTGCDRDQDRTMIRVWGTGAAGSTHGG